MNANEDYFEAEQPIYRLQYTLEGHESTRPINQDQEDQVILCVKFSPCGQSIASGGEGIIKVWDAAGKLESELVCENRRGIGIPEVDWSKDGSLLVSAGHHVSVWNVNTGKCVKKLRAHELYVFSAKFSPDDSLILSGSDECTARIWDAKSGVCLSTVMNSEVESVVAVDFHQDGTRFITTSYDGHCYVYDLRSLDIVQDFTTEDRAVVSAKFSTDSGYILFSMRDYSLKLYDMRNQKVAGIYKENKNNRALCSNFVLTTSGKYIVSGSYDDLIYIWDVNTEELVELLEGHSDYVECVDCHPENDTIVSGSRDNSIKIWKSS